MVPEPGVSPAGLVWLFAEQEVVGTGRRNVRVPAGVEVDEIELAAAVVARSLWGLAGRGLVKIVSVDEPRRRFRGAGARGLPVVRVLATGDAREPTAEGVLLGLLHGRAPVGRAARALDGLPDTPPGPGDRTDLRGLVAAGPPASGWLAACRREVEGVRREVVEDAYRASLGAWRATCEERGSLITAITLAAAEGLREASLPRRA